MFIGFVTGPIALRTVGGDGMELMQRIDHTLSVSEIGEPRLQTSDPVYIAPQLLGADKCFGGAVYHIRIDQDTADFHLLLIAFCAYRNCRGMEHATLVVVDSSCSLAG